METVVQAVVGQYPGANKAMFSYGVQVLWTGTGCCCGGSHYGPLEAIWLA